VLVFEKQRIHSWNLSPSGQEIKKPVEIRANPITGRTCRIAISRAEEREPATASLPDPPPLAEDRSNCPFCSTRVTTHTPRMIPSLCPEGRMRKGASYLFPNLFPYGSYSAVSLFDDNHFVEIGTASLDAYADSFLNCCEYLLRILSYDSDAIYMAITQNHLPSAGGSLLHPHLQVQADRIASNHHRFLRRRGEEYFRETRSRIFSDYLAHEKQDGSRYIGSTGPWEWMAAFAPEGFFEIWGVLPGITSIRKTTPQHWLDLARGVLYAQKFYRSLFRNAYNFGLLLTEDGRDILDLRVVLVVRSNYAPWVRSDFTGFEVVLGEMATFTPPEQTAERARPFWN
jgi:UDPglucose--hexose-1-phosphate uridylyltransferase